MIDAARRASAERITAVIPYFGYARQDRKDQPRVAVTAKLAANLLAQAGADRVLTMDLHAPQLQGFFDIPVDHLYAATILLKHFKRAKIGKLTVASPDVGGIQLARAYARRLHAPLAVLDKRRPKPNQAEMLHVIGEVNGRNVLLIDDIVDTAGTMKEAVHLLRSEGAKKVYATCTHPVLSGDALDNLQASLLDKLTVTDTIALPKEKRLSMIEIVSVAEIFAKGIRSIHESRSISSLFSAQ
jgi:ribose-phosphate pyrophosphokinase